MGLLEFLSKKEDTNIIREYLDNDAVIIDVRTTIEWNEGHIKKSTHITLNTIPASVDRIKAFEKPIIAVCKSGIRSQTAADFLSKQGLDAINGGAWQNVAQFIG